MKSSISSSTAILVIILVLMIAIPFSLNAQNADESAIKQLMENQSQAWNKGNIDDFMKGYWPSDSLVFIGKSGATYGYKTTLKNYKKHYPDTTAMGKLHFDLLQLKRLSAEYYYLLGRFTLQRSIGNLQGFFTLLFRKIKNRWMIISDHTS